MATHVITVPDDVPMINLLGYRDEVLRALERGLEPTTVHVRDHTITIEGDDIEVARTLISQLIDVVRSGEVLTAESVKRALSIVRDGISRPLDFLSADILTARGKTIRPKTIGQKEYVDAIDQNTIVFGIGPAGTGKTYLAMAKAVVALHSRQVSRIILTRPAVEAGESLGFLPGSLTDKIDPYVRPLYDALHDMVDPDSIPKLMAAGTIEVAPLAYMRGRTLNDAFIILDEAQNTTPEQMKMFLTRLGFNSTMVITGDITQIDLPSRQRSGLEVALRVLKEVNGIRRIDLTSADVVRHSLVSDIIDAYAHYEEEQAQRSTNGGNRGYRNSR